MTDAEAIRELILRWADAVHAGDLEVVLADHDPDIMMFDVPRPATVFTASTLTGGPGRLSSSGSDRVRFSRSSNST